MEPCKLEGLETDQDTWFSCLYCNNSKFKKINFLHEKDHECMKAHVLVNLPEEYKHVRMNLYMNANYTHKQYKMNIKHYWYTDLGGKEHLQTGRSECDNVIKKNQCHIICSFLKTIHHTDMCTVYPPIHLLYQGSKAKLVSSYMYHLAVLLPGEGDLNFDKIHH